MRLLRSLFVAQLLCFIHVYPNVAFASPPPQFLIFHLDAVSSRDFDRAFAAGRLPNIEAAFAGGARLNALSLYPGGTEILYPRLKSGSWNDTLQPVGWGWYDREHDRVYGQIDAFLEMLSYLPRRAYANFIHAAPYLDLTGLAGASMLNLPELLEAYGTIEFFWFATDVLGHWLGEEAHASSMEQFDHYLGMVLPRLDLGRVNLILYADHGMTFTNETVDLKRLVELHVGDALRYYDYPNLYLIEPHRRAEVAQHLALYTAIDYVFYRQDTQRVAGYFHGEFLLFEEEGSIRYLSETDPLGYELLGYQGEALSAEAWLELTASSTYPAVPPNVYRYLQHPDVGDVVIGVNPPKIPLTSNYNQGNHAGVMHTDLLVPILLKGPELEHLYVRELLWLNTLYLEIPALEFGILPLREQHRIELWLGFPDGVAVPGAQLLLSPAYRTRIGVLGTPERLQLWGEYDVFSTYLTRWWFGSGLLYHESQLVPVLTAQLEYEIAEGALALRGGLSPQGWQLGMKLSFRVSKGVQLDGHYPTGLGVSLSW